MLHESGRSGRADPIRLPLRMLLASAVRKELAGFDRRGSEWVRREQGIPGAGVLEGYAYRADGAPGKETCTLTAFGVGLRALLGIPGEAW